MVFVVSEVYKENSGARAKSGLVSMFLGALFCIGGIAITVVTMSAAEGGGTYVVTWGAILFGAIQFFTVYG